MDFQQLEAFYIIAKEKNFHTAARKLHISQPAISTRIAKLEKNLQIPLFHREGKKISLSQFGELLMDYAERILSLSEEARSTVTFAHEREKNYLNIGATNQTSSYILPNLLKQFYSKFPDIDLSVQTNHSKKIMELLEDGFIHIGIVNNRPDNQHYKSILLDQDRIILASSPAHPLYHDFIKHDSLSFEALNQSNVVNFRRKTSYYRSVYNLLDQYNIKPKQYITVDSVEAMKRMTMSSLGVGFFPIMTVQKEIDEGILFEIPFLPKHIVKVETFLVYRKNRYLNLAGQSFVTFTKEYFNNHKNLIL